MNSPNVILVDEKDHQIGIMEKMQAHREGRLHRAFSIFILNNKNEVLLQQRAFSKYHSPGLWTNACCSHPYPDEAAIIGANRRLFEEMGFNCTLTKIGEFTYNTQFANGLIEHEYDHVFAGAYDGTINPNPEEVADYQWISTQKIDELLKTDKSQFTFWFHLAYPIFKTWLNKNQLNF